MASDREIKLTILGDNRGAVAAIEGTETRLGGFKSALGSVGAVAGGFLAASVVAEGFSRFQGFIGGSIEAAASLEQSLGAVDQVFGDSAASIHNWAQEAADALGLSRNAYNELATMSGTIFKGMGLDIGTATEMTDELIGRGADLAAMFGGTPREAVERLNSAIIGNTEAVRSYGITLTAVDIQERALLDTGKERAADLTQAEKQQAAYALILERSADAAGQFSREQDTAAGSAARQAAAQENLQQQIGTYLLPLQVKWNEAKLAAVQIIAEKLVPALERFSGFVSENVMPVLRAFGEFIGPILGAYIEFVANNWRTAFEAIAPIAQEAFAQFKSFWESDGQPAFDNIVAAVGWVVDRYREYIPQLLTILQPVLAQVENTIRTVFGVIGALIATVTNAIAGDWSGAWNNIKRAGEIAWEGIKATIRNGLDFAIGAVRTAGPLLLEAAKGLGSAIGDGILDGLRAAGGFASDFAKMLGNAIIGVINEHVIDRINRAVEFTLPLPFGASFDVNPPDIPRIPSFGEGGLVPGALGAPVLALLHGGETVLPTHRSGVSATGQTVNVTVNVAGSLRTEHELEDVIVRAVSRAGRNGEFRGVLT